MMDESFYNRLYEGQVLINGADTVTGYNAARALYNTGFDVYGQASSKKSLYCKSRLWKKVYFGNFNIETLASASEEIQKENNARGIKPAIILSQDSAVEYMAKYRNEISRYYSFLLPENNVIKRLMDKTVFHNWALKNNILVPRSEIIKNKDDLDHALEFLTYPVVFKPLVRTLEWDTVFPNEKLIYIACDDDYKKVPDNVFNLCSSYIVQEWIPGGDENVFFVLAHINTENSCISLTGQKLLQWPVLSGSTAICISIDNQKLNNLGTDILKKAGLKGLGSIEFKKHSENNRFYVTEPTVGRNDYQSYIAVASKANLSLYYVLDCLSYSCSDNNVKLNAIWIDEINSLRSAFFLHQGLGIFSKVFYGIRYRISFANMTAYDAITFFRVVYELTMNKLRSTLNWVKTVK